MKKHLPFELHSNRDSSKQGILEIETIDLQDWGNEAKIFVFTRTISCSRTLVSSYPSEPSQLE